MAKNETYWDNLMAVYLDGKASPAEVRELLAELKVNPSLRETLEICLQTEEEQELTYPMLCMAAKTPHNLCAFFSELYILRKRGISVNSHALLQLAQDHHWVTDKGAPLYAIGQVLASQGLIIMRQYEASIDDIRLALQANNDVIVAVDIEKLYPNRPDPEDAPNHAMVVVNINMELDVITLFEPEVYATMDFRLSDFYKAWDESRNYIIYVSSLSPTDTKD